MNSPWVIDVTTPYGREELRQLCMTGTPVVDVTTTDGGLASYVLCGASKTTLIVEGWSEGGPDGTVDALEICRIAQVVVP